MQEASILIKKAQNSREVCLHSISLSENEKISCHWNAINSLTSQPSEFVMCHYLRTVTMSFVLLSGILLCIFQQIEFFQFCSTGAGPSSIVVPEHLPVLCCGMEGDYLPKYHE